MTEKDDVVRRKYDIKSLTEEGTFEAVLSDYQLDSVGDICQPGCYDATIKAKGTHRVLLFQHDPTQPVGGFDIVSTDPVLSIKGRFNLDVARAKEIYSLLKAGDIKGEMSIGYRAINYTYNDLGHRLLQEVDLIEGSILSCNPANDRACVSAVKTMEASEVTSKLEMALSGLTDEQKKSLLEALTEKKSEDETEGKEDEHPAGEEDCKEDEPETEDKSEDETEDEDGEDDIGDELKALRKELDELRDIVKTIKG